MAMNVLRHLRFECQWVSMSQSLMRVFHTMSPDVATTTAHRHHAKQQSFQGRVCQYLIFTVKWPHGHDFQSKSLKALVLGVLGPKETKMLNRTDVRHQPTS